MVRREESMSFGMIRSLASQSLSHNKKSICLLRYHTSPLLFLLSTHDLTQILSKHYGKILKLNSLLILDRGLHLVILMTSSEKLDGNAVSRKRTDDFNYVINTCSLINLGFSGPKFTWSSCRKCNLIMERLDRFLVNPLWLSQFFMRWLSTSRALTRTTTL